MFRSFMHDKIGEFEYHYEEERGTCYVAYFNHRLCKEQVTKPNFYICGYNLKHLKYVIKAIPCYLHKIGANELKPTYDYGTDVDNYYETFDEMINEFAKLIQRQIDYKISIYWEDGYTYVHMDDHHTYYGKINEEYLIFTNNDKFEKDIIYRQILKRYIKNIKYRAIK